MMIKRFPLRVSLFGGGTDYPEWFATNGGLVLGGAINLSVEWRYQSGEASSLSSIEHDILEKSCDFLELPTPRGISTNSSEFVGRGLGASSASLAALFSLLSELNQKEITKRDLIKKITYFERFVLGKEIGIQDQILTIEQKLCCIDFHRGDRGHTTTPIKCNNTLSLLNNNLYLLNTKVDREFQNIPQKYINSSTPNCNKLEEIFKLAKRSWSQLKSNKLEVENLAVLLNKSWVHKKSVSPLISNSEIDKLYDTALCEGAIGGKLLGAGGGGHLLLVIENRNVEQLKKALPNYNLQKITFLS